MTVMELDALKDVDVRTVEKEGLVDIREVEIDRSLPLEERKRAYLEAVGNPYAVRVGDMKVRVRFMEGGGLSVCATDCRRFSWTDIGSTTSSSKSAISFRL